MLCQQHLRDFQSVFDLQAVRRDLLLPQFHAQQVVRRHQSSLNRKFHLAVNLLQLAFHGFDGRKVVAQRHDLPVIGVGLLAHLGLGLLQLQASDLLAQPGEFVAVDDFQPREDGLHGRDAAHKPPLDHRQRQVHRPQLRDGHAEIGLHQSVLGLENASRGRDLREVAGQRLAARLQGRFKLEPAVAERAVVFGGGCAAFVERQGLRSGRKGRAAENQIYESLFHHL